MKYLCQSFLLFSSNEKFDLQLDNLKVSTSHNKIAQNKISPIMKLLMLVSDISNWSRICLSFLKLLLQRQKIVGQESIINCRTISVSKNVLHKW